MKDIDYMHAEVLSDAVRSLVVDSHFNFDVAMGILEKLKYNPYDVLAMANIVKNLGDCGVIELEQVLEFLDDISRG